MALKSHLQLSLPMVQGIWGAEVHYFRMTSGWETYCNSELGWCISKTCMSFAFPLTWDSATGDVRPGKSFLGERFSESFLWDILIITGCFCLYGDVYSSWWYSETKAGSNPRPVNIPPPKTGSLLASSSKT